MMRSVRHIDQVTIEVKDAGTGAGNMVYLSYELTNALEIAGGTLNQTVLTGSDQALVTDASLTSGSYTLSSACTIYQTAHSADLAGTYSLTLTFTATFSDSIP